MTAGTRFVLNQSLFHVSSSFRCRLWQCGRSMRNTLCISHDSKRDHSLLLFMIRKPNPAYSMVSINCTIKSRCSGRKADHFSSMVACSCVSTIGSRSADSTTEKNSDTETLNASQSFSRVGKVGMMFLRYYDDMVVGLIPASLAKS